MAIEIVDLPINSMVIFHGKMLVHQRVHDITVWGPWGYFDSDQLFQSLNRLKWLRSTVVASLNFT